MEQAAAARALTPPSLPQPSTSTASSAPADNIWAKLDRNASRAASTVASTTEAEHGELQQYLREPSISRSQFPLNWWAVNKDKYPSLAALAAVARCILAIPATSVASERLFSKAGDVITKTRNQLAPRKADTMLFLMENM